MTVASAVSRVDYVGNGATSVYPYTFKIFASSDLRVTRQVIATGVETLLVLTTDYSVSGVGAESGGNVTLVAGNLPSTQKITIRRVRPLTQGTDIRNQGDFLPETHEDEFDRGVMLDQQLQDQIGRCLKLQETEVGADALTKIPIASVRADKFFKWDSSGNPTATSVLTTGALSVSSFVETLLDDANAASFMTTLGITAFAQTILDDADAATARTTLDVERAAVEVTPAAIGGNTNDYAIAGDSGYKHSVVRVSASAAFNVTGMTDGSSLKRRTFINVGSFAISLTHQDAASAAANRLINLGGATLVLNAGDSVHYYYDNTTQRWRQTWTGATGTGILSTPNTWTATQTFSAAVGAIISDELQFTSAGNATATGRLRRNGNNLTWHDGTADRQIAMRGGTNTFTGTNIFTGVLQAQVSLMVGTNDAAATALDVHGALAIRRIVTVTLGAGNNNNVGRTGGFIRYTCNVGGSTITGWTAGQNGELLFITVDPSGGTLVIADQNGASSAANQIIIPSGVNISMPNYGTAIFMYCTATTRWMCMGQQI
jgi:hypothetical protein